MISDAAGKTHLTVHYKHKAVKVTLEFPKQSDLKFGQEFLFRLKMLYLGKMGIHTMQKEKENMDCE